MTCTFTSPGQGESWRPFSKLFSCLHVGSSNTGETLCVCLLLELPAIAWPCYWLSWGHGPKALLTICYGWAVGHQPSALSQGVPLFPAWRIKRKWWGLSSYHLCVNLELILPCSLDVHELFQIKVPGDLDFSLEGTVCFSHGVQSEFSMSYLRLGVSNLPLWKTGFLRPDAFLFAEVKCEMLSDPC